MAALKKIRGAAEDLSQRLGLPEDLTLGASLLRQRARGHPPAPGQAEPDRDGAFDSGHEPAGASHRREAHSGGMGVADGKMG